VGSVVKTTLIALALAWLARCLLRRVRGLAVIAAILVGASSIAGEHGVDVVGVRRSVACGVTALQRAAKQLPDVAAPSVTAAKPRTSDPRLARCQRDGAPAFSRSPR